MASNMDVVPIEDSTDNRSVVIREDTTNAKNSLKDSPTLTENMISIQSSVVIPTESFTPSLDLSLERKKEEKADAVSPDLADASSAVPPLSADSPNDNFPVERESSQNELVFEVDVDIQVSNSPVIPGSKEPDLEPEPTAAPDETTLLKASEPSSPAEKPTLISTKEEKEEDHLLDEIETALSRETADELQLSKARQSLILAKESHSQATQKVLDDANEYAKIVDSDLSKLARDVQMISSKAWYNFWQTATRIPKDSKYETVTGEKVPWKDIVKKDESLLREIVAENDGWKKVSNADSVKVETSPRRSKGTKLYKLTTTLSVSPKVALLPLVRGPLLGKTDTDLIYFREHYNFVGGMTSLVQTIRTVLPYERVQARDFFDLTNWIEDADGSVWYTAQSVKALPLLKSNEPKITRGSTLFYGFHARPNEVGGSEVTVIVQVRLNGWVPNIVMDWSFPTVLVAQVKAIEKAAKAVRETGEEDKFVRKFLYRELDVGDVPAIAV